MPPGRVVSLIAVGVLSLSCASGTDDAPLPSTANGPPEMTLPSAGDAAFQGRVTRLLPAGGYTYLEVLGPAGPRWVVTIGGGQPVGADVNVNSFGARKAFRSRRLGRTFDDLLFAVVRRATKGGR
jgi:hypothetical protein